MTTRTLTSETFEQTLLDSDSESDIVLVDFWAAWCGPCRTFAPIFENASASHPDITFGKVDTEAEQSLAAGAGITSIPTLMAFRDGILVFSQPGALPASALEQVIAGVRGLDMDDIKAQIAQSQAAAQSHAAQSHAAQSHAAQSQAAQSHAAQSQAAQSQAASANA